MKLKNLLSGICAASIVALSLVGCSDYDNGYTEQQLKFIQNFKDVFGEIDHNNDWNLAEQGSVTVTTSQPSRVKIYANTFGTYKIVGDYEDVSGTKTLVFDMVEGTTDILVSNGHTARKAKVGDGVSFAGTRYVYTGDNQKKNSKGEPIVTLGDEDGDPSWKTFPTKDYIDIITDEDNGFLPEGKNNLGNVTQNFSYVSQGPFTIYPIFIQSSSSHILGIYWKDDEGNYQTQNVYRNNAMYPTKQWMPVNEPTGDYPDYIDEEGYKARPITINLDEGVEFGFFLEVYHGSDGSTETGTDDDGRIFDNRNPSLIRHCIYSENELNQEYKGQTFDKRQYDVGIISDFEDDRAWAGTFMTEVDGEIVTYIAFEDWGTIGKWDLNDLVFIMEGDLPAIVDNDAHSWVVSCEDLGGKFDIDYNDVVLKVTHTSGQTDLMVEPLAAGGTLASFVYFGDGVGEDDISLGEIHHLFGQEEGKISGSYEPVNVDKGQQQLQEVVNPIQTLTVSPAWSLASFTPTTASAEAQELARNRTMGGFYVKVVPAGKVSTEENVEEHLVDGKNIIQRIQNTVERNEDNVPYVICTPYEWRRTEIKDGKTVITRGTYRWPCENMPMFPFGDFQGGEAAYTGYGDPAYSFKSWVRGRLDENHVHLQTSIYWYRYPNIENTVGNTLPAETESDGNGGTNDDKGLYFQTEIARNGSGLGTNQNVYTGTSIILEDEFYDGDVLYIYIRDEKQEVYVRTGAYAYYEGDENTKYEIGKNDWYIPSAIAVNITGSGTKTIFLYVPQDIENGYGERTVAITITIEATE